MRRNIRQLDTLKREVGGLEFVVVAGDAVLIDEARGFRRDRRGQCYAGLRYARLWYARLRCALFRRRVTMPRGRRAHCQESRRDRA